jgi:thiosulfate dehydrogenase (quinone) large subunit
MAGSESRTRFSVKVEYVLALGRILLGWLFLWGFLDKVFGLGFATSSSDAWINGGSPTEGFLKFGTSGIFQDFYNSIAGNVVVDWLFMLALLALGISLTLGIGMRIAAYGGTLFLLLLWGANVPPINNPIIDEHIIFIALLWILYKLKAGRYFGLGVWWSNTSLVRRVPWLE